MDKAGGIRLVINRIFAEGRQFLAVQAVGGYGARGNDVALVQLQLYITCHGLLRAFHKGRKRLAQRGIPLAVVYKIGKFLRHQRFVVRGLLIQTKHFQLLVRKIQNRAARCFVYAAALHAHKAVFYNINDAHAVGAADGVQLL